MTEQDRVYRQHRFPHAEFPNALTLDPGTRRGALSNDAKVLWAVLDTYALKNESAWPGQDLLAWEMGDVTDRTIRRWITELREHGWLEIRPHIINGRKAGNEYVLIVINQAANERIRARRQSRPPMNPDRTSVTKADRTNESKADRTSVSGRKEKQSPEKQSPENHTPPTPLAEGGAIEVIEGTIEDEGSTTPDPLRGYRWSGALTRRGGAPTERERAQAEEVFEAWVESPTLIGGRRRGAARLDGKRMEAIVQRLRDGYEVADLADACRGWTRIPHNRGDGTDTRGQKFDSLTLILRNADQVDRFLSAWRDPVDEAAAMERAALARQAVRNPMLAAAKAIAPAGMERAPEHHPAVKDALDAATLRWREDEIRAGRDAREHMPEEMRRQVIEEAVAALAVPC